ncbi:MAG: uncharacterized protein PWP03_597 [Candidatus Woesearchaeota archaeon]|nr:uncharacterized protein [Candidatus Woesearchaeota archaeon]MDN5327959.1 uncharacterized protein [Candidatus Woesearchaeota archaeon]
MPHQCVHCGAIYEDNAKEILEGCSRCGSKLFFYIRKERLEELKNFRTKLSEDEIKKIEDDILDLIGEEVDKNKPVVLDLETVRVDKEGKYLIDLVNLFKGSPLIYKVAEGKYYIDLKQSFDSLRKDKKK